ncbi:nitroreductase family protein [Schaalia sp. 19OD2882]|uniref:nitroreductase family protein n=1 Tax=Schaalia sp. 19OD2882 TaxID=2794089 RepID=UPI001C1ED392|nr:nitroreductase family protein [Schaalia sp. 19OD2882]QWW20045.1 nitroreductase family protein [Schaalia sp. 19OD2882]
MTTAHDFRHLAQARRSMRDFLPDPVPQEVLDEILVDAAQTPSWSNTRPYELVLATGEVAQRVRAGYLAAFEKVVPMRRGGRLAALSVLAKGAMPDGDFPLWRPYPPELKKRADQVGRALYAHLGIARGDREGRIEAERANFRAFGAPVIGFVLVHTKMLPVSAMDAGIMLQTLFLSAKARGVDSCALGSLALWRTPLEAEFELPKHYALITGFALGYASGAPVNDFRASHPALVPLPPRDSSVTS